MLTSASKWITIWWSLTFATSHRAGELWSPKFKIDRLLDFAVAQQCDNYLSERTAGIQSSPENSNEHWAAIENSLVEALQCGAA